MYYSDDVVEEVRSSCDIVDIIGGYVNLKKKGSSYFGLCPFHNEKTGSFSVSGQKQMYYCFGCGAGGNVFTFLMEYENSSFTEAVETLAEKAGIKLPQLSQTQEDRKRTDEKNILFSLEKEAARYYYSYLKSDKGKQALQYLTERQLSDETIKKFGLGASSKFSDEIYIFLKNKGYTDQQLESSGLVVFDEKKGAYDRFWNRVMFPIMDVSSRVIGFGGRVMGDGKPKYMNSPESIIFDKSKNLYGLNIARSSRYKFLLLCEGYMDVIAMHQAGFNNAVASLGTAFTYGHARLLKRYTEEVYLLYDSDEAGIKAALRAIPILQETGLGIKVVDLKPYKDPDELVKALGAEGLRQRIETAMDSFLFEITQMKRDYDMEAPRQATSYYKQVARKLLSFPAGLERNTYTAAAARLIHKSYEDLNQFVSEEGKATGGEPVVYKPVNPVISKTMPKDDGVLKSERFILTTLVDNPNTYKLIKKYLRWSDFSEGIYRETAEIIFNQLEGGNLSIASISSMYQDGEKQRQLAQIFNARIDSIDSEEKLAKVLSEQIYKIRKNSYTQEMVSSNKGDLSVLQEFINKKKQLDKLRNLNISPSEWRE